MHTYQLADVSPDMSFLEMLDVLNEQLNDKGEDPIAFDSDCREGICGMCGLMINGDAHGPEVTTTCQLHMRSFTDGETITIEPWRSDAFPVVKDLVVDRGAFDRIIQAGGYISVNTGSAPEAHSVPVPKDDADRAFNVATCIGCGACVAACPNGSASLFMGAKVTHLGLLPQGQPERDEPRGQHGRPARPRGLRRLHQHRRLHRRLPQGDPARRDLAAQQGPPHRDQARSLSDVLLHRRGPGVSPGPRRVSGRCVLLASRAVREARSALGNLRHSPLAGRATYRPVREPASAASRTCVTHRRVTLRAPDDVGSGSNRASHCAPKSGGGPS